MRKPGGYAIMTDERGIKEWDCFTCCHCGKIVHVKPFADPADMGGLCYSCSKPICPNCVGKGCVPLEKQIEMEEARYHALRSYGLA